jgi:hypothetical protein
VANDSKLNPSACIFPGAARRALRLVGLAILVYLGLCVLFFWRQESYLFYPTVASLTVLKEEARTRGFTLWPRGDAGYLALLAEPAGVPARGTYVVFHGNAGAAQHRDYIAAPLTALGYRVLLVEYPGFGARPTGLRREQALVEEARTVVREAHRHYGGSLYLLGESLGAAVAAAAAADRSLPVQGVLLVTPWNSLLDVAQYHFPWLPVALLLRDSFDSGAHLAAYPRRVGIVVAGQDEIIPAALGRRLYEELTDGKRLWILPEASHNDWPGQVTSDDWQEWTAHLYRRQHAP